MNEHFTSAFSLFSIFSLLGAGAATWNLQRRKQKEQRAAEVCSEEGWVRCADQPASALYREERHSVKAPESGTEEESFSVVREERFVSRETGLLVATLPERQVADAENEDQANEILAFFEEVARSRSEGSPEPIRPSRTIAA